MNNLFICLVVFASLTISPLAQSQCLKFEADLSMESEWEHYWEKCVGSGHALLGLRKDYLEHLTLAHDRLGFQYVRFHGVFDDDMSVIINIGNGNEYSFYNIDQLYDNIIALGMRPVVELSFMPELIAKNSSQTVFHYKGITSPPSSMALWTDLITNVVKHWVDRYGLDEVKNWYFEVWNEPNCGFFSGTQAEYFQLLKATSEAIHAVHPVLRVGGPATCQSQWIDTTVDLMNSGYLHLDFISTHMYPTDFGTPVKRDIMLEIITEVKKIVGDIPLLYTEYNDGLYTNPPYHDTSYASAFIFKNIVDVYGLVDLLSWWTFSDIFEEPGQISTIFGKDVGWGLLALHAIPKPSFRAFELLHQTGNKRVNVTPGPNDYPTVGVLVTKNDTHAVINAWNHNTPNSPISQESVCVTVNGFPSSFDKPATITRIDDSNVNPYKAWDQMGNPVYPTAEQIQSLIKASEFVYQNINYTKNGTSLQFQFNLPPQGVASIAIPLN